MTNERRGVQPWRGLDARNALVKRAIYLRDAFVEDLGGRDEMSNTQWLLCERAALSASLLEELEKRLLAGEVALDATALGELVRLQSQVVSILKTLGVERRPRKLADPLDYAASNGATA